MSRYAAVKLGNNTVEMSVSKSVSRLRSYGTPCVDVPWAQRVHSDLLGAQFAGHATRHLQYRGLGRVVRHPGVVL